MSSRWRHLTLAATTLMLLAVLWLVAEKTGSLTLFGDVQRMATWIRDREPWAPLAIVVLQVSQVLLAPIPGQVVGMAGGYLFGAWLGAFYSLIGTAIGSWIALALARVCGRPLVERLVPPQTLARLDAGAQRRGLFFFALVFLLPFLPDDLACFAAGLTRIPIPALMAAAVTARAPGILASSWLGAHAEGLSRTQWAILIAASVALAGLFLVYGERLQGWLMARVAQDKEQTSPRPPSRGA